MGQAERRRRPWDDLRTALEDFQRAGWALRSALASGVPQMSSADDADGFQLSYGGKRVGDHIYFNVGAAATAEDWQVLSPRDSAFSHCEF